MVFHEAHHDFVPCPEVGSPPSHGDQVEGLRRVAGEDDAPRVHPADEARDAAARANAVLYFLDARGFTTGMDWFNAENNGVPSEDVAATALDLEDQFGIIADPELAPLQAMFQATLMSAPGMRIAGGTDEILKNIIAERVLGLPQDVRLDKTVAFKDIPSGR